MSLRLSSSVLILFLIVSVFSAAAQTPLVVAAAADLAPLQIPLQDAFHRDHPRIELRFSSGASGVLAQQIENGAPYDLFLSANSQFVDGLSAGGKLLPDSVKVYATGRLGVLWRDGKQHELEDLSKGWVRFLALPNPKLAPYGVAAQQALEHVGVWPAVQHKIVYGENVRQTLQLFESGNADVVITADSLLVGKNPNLLPVSWHRPILQKAGIVAGSKNQLSARAFLDFLTSPAGQAVFADFGFASPPAPSR